LIDAFYADQLTIAYTDSILAEYMDVMERPEFAATIDDNTRRSLAMKLRANGILVQPSPVPPAAWPDLDDLPFVAAALSTPGKFLVTLNPRDFAPATAFGLRVMSPAEARRELL
jgi:predicted nucleic acid-binding protein